MGLRRSVPHRGSEARVRRISLRGVMARGSLLNKACSVVASVVMVTSLCPASALAEVADKTAAQDRSALEQQVDLVGAQADAIGNAGEDASLAGAVSEGDASESDASTQFGLEAVSADVDGAASVFGQADQIDDAIVLDDEGLLNAQDEAVQASAIPADAVSPAYSGGTGQADDPYQIATAADLNALREAANTTGKTLTGYYYKMTADIDMAGTLWDSGIGRSTSTYYFSGNFDGAGHTIKGLNIKSEKKTGEDSYLGLFGYINSATTSVIATRPTVKNLTVEGSVENADAARSLTQAMHKYTGGIVGAMSYAAVENVTSKVNVTASGYVGNMSAKTGASSTSNSAITGGIAGAISGYNGEDNGSVVRLSNNYGTVKSSSFITGGIVGYTSMYNSILDCENHGAIDNYGFFAGGVLGVAGGYSEKVSNCLNDGDVSSSVTAAQLVAINASAQAVPNAIGGVVGYVNGGAFKLTTSANKGNVTAESVSVGGVIGCLGSFSYGRDGNVSSALTSGAMSDCYNTGTVATHASDSNAAAGGIAGVLATAAAGSAAASGCGLARCYNVGGVSAPSISSGYVGAIVGAPYAADLPTSAISTVVSNFYLTGSADYAFGAAKKGSAYDVKGGGTSATADALKAEDGLGDAYTLDASNTINNGFPYLNWESENSTFAVGLTVSYDTLNNVGDDPQLTLKRVDGAEEVSLSLSDETGSAGERTFSGRLHNGTYTYTLSQKGYGVSSDCSVDDPITGTFIVARNPLSLNVSAVAKRYNYELAYDPDGAYVSSAIRVTSDDSATDSSDALDAQEGEEEFEPAATAAGKKTFSGLTCGTYEVRINKFGYTPAVHRFAISYDNAQGTEVLAATPTHKLSITFNAPAGSSFSADNLPKLALSATDSQTNKFSQDVTATIDPSNPAHATIELSLSEYAADEDGTDSAYTYHMTAAGFNAKRGTFDMSKDCDFTFDLQTKSVWDGTIDTSWYDPNNRQSEYVITTPEQLAGISELVHQRGCYNNAKYCTDNFSGVTFRLANDLNLGGSDGYNWYPIGYYSSDCAFRGTFDGQGHTIKGLSLKSADNMLGLFGGIVDGTIMNLTVEGDISSSMKTAGGIAGEIMTSSIINCTSRVNIQSKTYSDCLGGIVGDATWNFSKRGVNSTIECCTFEGTLSSLSTGVVSGGIVGCASAADVTACVNNGSISAKNATNKSSSSPFDYYGVGGIIGTGSNYSSVSLCINNGNIGGTNVGGIAGDIEGTAISNCYNTGIVNGINGDLNPAVGIAVGGVVGHNDLAVSNKYGTPTATVSNCYNRGAVISAAAGKAYAGGVLGASECTEAFPTAENNTTISSNYGLADTGAKAAFGGWGSAYSSSNLPFDLAQAGETLSESDLKAAAPRLGIEYAADTDSEYNEGFPYLLWQNPDAKFQVVVDVSYDDAGNAGDTLPTVKVFSKTDGTEVPLAAQAGMSWSYSVDPGEYYYTVEQDGYTSVGPVDFTVSSHSVALSTKLAVIKYAMTVTVDPADSKLVMSAEDGTALKSESFDEESGAYTFSVTNGRYTYAASKFAYDTETDVIDVSFGDVTRTISLKKADSGTVSFTASPASGAFKAIGATIVLYRDNIETYRFTKEPDADGVVRLSEQVSVGEYSYMVAASGFSRATGTCTVSKDATSIVSVSLEEKGGWGGTADYTWGLGENYKINDTFTIASEEQLAGLSYLVNSRGVNFDGKTINLVCDLDLNNRNWSGIGTSSRGFAGTFDGGGFSIDGLNVEAKGTYSGSYLFGLFGYVSGGSVNDLVVRGNVRLGSLSVSSTTACSLGGVAARSSDASFTNCGSEVNITVGNTSDSVAANVGGIVGWGVSTSLAGCYNTGTITVESKTPNRSGVYAAGGLSGYLNGGGEAVSVTDSYNLGTVSVDADAHSIAGGLVGRWGSGSNTQPAVTMRGSYDAGAVTACVNEHVENSEALSGAIVGDITTNDGSVVANTYYLKDCAQGAFGDDVADLKGSIDVVEEPLSQMIDLAFVQTLNDGGKAYRAADEPYYPMLSWQKDVRSVELVAMPSKLDYVDGENFDGYGAQLKVVFASGDERVIDSGWVAVNGVNLRPGTTEVTLSYQGHSVKVPVNVSWHDQQLPSDFKLSVAAPVPDAEPASSLGAVGEAMIDAMPHMTQSVAWTSAGEPMIDSLFAAETYYRAQVVLTAAYDDAGHYLFPEDIDVTVDGAYRVANVSRSDDGRTLTFDLLFAPSSTASPDVDPDAMHLFYEGDASVPLASSCLPGEGALTLVDSEGAEYKVSLKELEELVLREPVGREVAFSKAVDGSIEQHSYAGISLYKLMQLYGVLYSGMSDGTQITFTDAAGRTYDSTMGDIRNARPVFDSAADQTSTATAQISFACDGKPLFTGNSLLSGSGPLMLNMGMTDVADTEDHDVANIVRVAVGEPVTGDQSKLSFEVFDDLGGRISNPSLTVVDESGNEIPFDAAQGAFAINNAETYTYRATSDGYTVSTNTISIEEDTTVQVQIVPCWDGVTLTEPAKDDEGYYLIGTGAELAWWNRNGKQADKVKLTRDVALGDACTYEAADTDSLDKGNWIPMSSKKEADAFQGTFDGQGHTIYGLYINRENTIDLWLGSTGDICMTSDRRSTIGMFGYAIGATIKDLGVVGKIYVLDRPDSAYADWVQAGGIVGLAQSGCTITGCYTNIGISIIQSTGGGFIIGDDGSTQSYDGNANVCDQYIGGIAGSISASCEVQNCYTTGAYIGGGTRSVSMGGIVGGMRGVSASSNLVANCYSDSIIAGTPLDTVDETTITSAFGGIVGKPAAVQGAGMVPEGMGVNASDDVVALSQVGDENECCTAEELARMAKAAVAPSDGGSGAAGAGAAADSADASPSTITCIPYVQRNFAFNSVIDGKFDTSSRSSRSQAGRVYGNTYAQGMGNYALSTMQLNNVTVVDDVNANGSDLTYADTRFASTYTDAEWDSDVWNIQDGAWPLLKWQTPLGIISSITDNFTLTPGEDSSGKNFTVGIRVDGHDAITFGTYTLADMERMAVIDSTDGMKLYSSMSYSGVAGRIVTKYVYPETILKDLGITFASGDVWRMGMDYDYDTYFGTKRYYFPHWNTYSEADAVEVRPVIAVKSYGDKADMSDGVLRMFASAADTLWAYVLNFGQTNVGDYTYNRFMKQQDSVTVVYEATASANATVSKLANDAIAQATADLEATREGTDESQMPYGATFVSPDQYRELSEQIAAAEDAMRVNPTNDAAMSAYERLTAAKASFDAAKRTGSYRAGASELAAAVDVATEDLRSTLIDSNTAQVSEVNACVDADSARQLLDALRQAKDILSSSELVSDATLSEVMSKLTAINDAYDAAKVKGSATGIDRIIRRAGATRLETSVALSQTAYPLGCDTVVIATGGNFPDALSGSALAGVLDAPILLADQGGLTEAVKAEIERLGAKRAVLLGGEGALSSAVVDQLANCGIDRDNVQRLAGETRFETSMDIYEMGEGSWGKTAIVASGENYPDALSIAGYANDSASPIFLADASGSLSGETLSAIVAGDFDRVIIVGGNAVVSEQTESSLRDAEVGGTVKRLSGDTRYGTNEKVNEWLTSTESDSGFTAANAAFATGENFADALSGSAVNGCMKSILVLVEASDEQATLKRFAPYASCVETAYLFGGEASVSPWFATSLNEAVSNG